MTDEQMIEHERRSIAEYEAGTVVTEQGETIADLRKIADAIFDEEDWKRPWAAAVPHQIVGAVLRTVEFFHGAEAETVGIERITGKVLMRGDGYAC